MDKQKKQVSEQNCADCIHAEVCAGYEVTMPACKHFADKSLYIKLPCKVDDVVFVVITGRVLPFDVISISIYKTTPTFKAQHGIHLVWVFGAEDIGKTVFLSREEAEAALEGRK